jgi:hypothetical protein
MGADSGYSEADVVFIFKPKSKTVQCISYEPIIYISKKSLLKKKLINFFFLHYILYRIFLKLTIHLQLATKL